MPFSNVPKNFVIGDAVEFTVDLADYSADDYVMKFALVTSTSQKIWTSSASGRTFVFDVDTSSGYSEGQYSYQIFLINNSTSKRTAIADGKVTALPDLLSATGGHDSRSALQIQLEEVNTAISAVMAMKSYTIQNRTFTRENLSELRNTKQQILRQMNRAKSGGAITRQVNLSGTN